MIDKIEEFIEKRPEVVAAYGYGSGIFKQSGYTSKDKPQIDLILVVDDLRKWHLENMKLNRNDYSLTGRLFFKKAPISQLKGSTGITYVSNILENGNVFKYGTIEKKDLIINMSTWKSFYMPGRFQKTVYPIKENEFIKEMIDMNREDALLLASYLQKNDEVSKKDLLVTICSLSYLGDTRMKFAENPRKVLNIVEGSYDELTKIYNFNNDYLKEKDNIKIDRSKLKEKLKQLPANLLRYIDDSLNSEDDIIRQKILEYFTELNKKESTSQTIKGIYTNGVCRSINYASKKLAKRFKK